MFVDKVEVKLKAGNGGNGIVSFRHEKFVDRGGPDGGDGGNGGNIVLAASRNQNTLADFRYKKTLTAEAGQAGGKRKMHGKSGEDLVVAVPVGTMVTNSDGETLADLTQDGQQMIVAKGGKGGFGNAHFVSSRRQAPRVAEKGEAGDSLTVTMELKLIADVGLVGLPNAGKSTLLASLSNARPEIADYPFTTLTPNLGVVDVDSKTTLLLADIPGLIEGASEGKGLGDEFLRHIERTGVILHLIDAYQEDLAGAYKTVQNELKAYRVDLTKRPQVVALNKVEGIDEQSLNAKLSELQKVVPAQTPLYAISAKSKIGLDKLLFELKDLVKKQRTKTKRQLAKKPVLKFMGDDDSWVVKKDGDTFVITGNKIERFARRTDFNSIEGVERLRDIMRKMGIMKELERQGGMSGDKLKIGKLGTIEY